MSFGISVRKQIQRNIVALVSLTVAVTSLGYNTWRNEVIEYDRQRESADGVGSCSGSQGPVDNPGRQSVGIRRYFDDNVGIGMG